MAVNPFKIFVVLGLVAAIALASWFVYVFYVDPGNNGSLNIVEKPTTAEIK